MNDDSLHNPDYSSRNRWLGPTPQILFWQLTGPCPLMDHFSNYYRPPVGPAKTVQTLRPVKEWSIARDEGRIQNDFAILRKDQPQLGGKRQVDLGFSVSENLAAFGGEDYVFNKCTHCTTAGTDSSKADRNEIRFASCCGFLPETSSLHMHLWTHLLQSNAQPLPAPNWNSADWPKIEIPFTAPPAIRSLIDQQLVRSGKLGKEKKYPSSWAWLMSQKEISPEIASDIRVTLQKEVDQERIRKIASNSSPSDQHKPAQFEVETDLANHPFADSLFELREFLLACETSIRTGASITIQAHPAGFSDGNDWWIGPHCGRCVHPMGLDQKFCPECEKDSGPVPLRKRRIMGWAPYWPLHSISDNDSH